MAPNTSVLSLGTCLDYIPQPPLQLGFCDGVLAIDLRNSSIVLHLLSPLTCQLDAEI